jgi:hypothetical protein
MTGDSLVPEHGAARSPLSAPDPGLDAFLHPYCTVVPGVIPEDTTTTLSPDLLREALPKVEHDIRTLPDITV